MSRCPMCLIDTQDYPEHDEFACMRSVVLGLRDRFYKLERERQSRESQAAESCGCEETESLKGRLLEALTAMRTSYSLLNPGCVVSDKVLGAALQRTIENDREDWRAVNAEVKLLKAQLSEMHGALVQQARAALDAPSGNACPQDGPQRTCETCHATEYDCDSCISRDNWHPLHPPQQERTCETCADWSDDDGCTTGRDGPCMTVGHRYWQAKPQVEQPRPAPAAECKPVGWTSQRNLDHLREIQEHDSVWLYPTRSDHHDVPLYAAPPPPAEVQRVLSVAREVAAELETGISFDSPLANELKAAIRVLDGVKP